MNTSPTRLLRPELLASLTNLELVARSVVEGYISGMHRSPRFGFSQEFAEYRNYQPGDDTRFIDWNVYARSGKTYIKRFVGETNAHLTLMLDASASMNYAGQAEGNSHTVSKLQYAKFIAAALAYLGKRQQDALGLMIFAQDVLDFRPPSGSTSAFPAILHSLEATQSGSGTALDKPILQFCEALNRVGIVVVISDFLDHPEVILEQLKPLAGRRQDVLLLQVLHHSELNPQFDGSVRLEDMESGEQLTIDAHFANNAYAQKIRDHVHTIRESAHKVGAEYLLVDTSQPLDQVLSSYLRLRARRP